MSANTHMEAALGYAARGWRVFPLRPGKKTPIHSGGFKIATTDPERIRQWWTDHPTANIGIATGAHSGIVVLDIDMKHGVDGEASLRSLLNGHAALPATLEQRTPSGGRHKVFAAPEGRQVRNSAGKLARGLDVRGDGGYIVAPPSTTDEGEYCWIDPTAAPAPAPEWLFAPAARIPAGERNAQLTSIAGGLRARGMESPAILEALRSANEQRLDPPLEAAEVEGIARGIARYRPGRPLTDLGNAERLADAFEGRLVYCSQMRRWFAWDSSRWRIDEDGAVHRAMRTCVRALYVEAAAESDNHRRAALAKWAATSEGAGRLRAAVELAAHDARLIVNVEALDCDPSLLGLRNGTLNLKTGELLPSRPADRITKQALVTYTPEARCPLWERFLARIFADDAQLIAYLQRAVGYSLTGDTMAKTLFFLYGPGGDNGKSTLIETLVALLGDYALKTRAETFMRGSFVNTGATPERVALRGARLVVASELSDRQQFDESFLKDVTGGVDRIAARNLYEGMIQFKPAFKLWLYGNHKPRLRSDDDAAWRRLHLIPFEVRIPLEEQDPELGWKLIEELPGILNWALLGLSEWRKRKLAPPEKVTAAVACYRDEMDDVGRFLDECCVIAPQATVKGGSLYAAYAKWTEENGQRPMANARFSGRLADRGVQKRVLDGRTVWVGLGLRAGDDAF